MQSARSQFRTMGLSQVHLYVLILASVFIAFSCGKPARRPSDYKTQESSTSRPEPKSKTTVRTTTKPPHTGPKKPGPSRKTCPHGQLYHVESDSCYPSDVSGPCRSSSMMFTLDLDKFDGLNFTFNFSKEDLFSSDFLNSKELKNATDQLFHPHLSEDENVGSEDLRALFSAPEHHEHVGTCDCRVADLGGCHRRPMLFHKVTQQCYTIFSQGPCKSGEWFVAKEYEQARLHLIEGVCVKNPCKNQQRPKGDMFIYYHHRKCFQTGTRGHCQREGQVAFFSDFSYYSPRCSSPSRFDDSCFVDSDEDDDAIFDPDSASVENVKPSSNRT